MDATNGGPGNLEGATAEPGTAWNGVRPEVVGSGAALRASDRERDAVVQRVQEGGADLAYASGP